MSLRQESLGEEEEPRTRKPFVGTPRILNPAWQSRASSQKRVLRGEGRPSLRSVDSQVKGRVIEPRKLSSPGAFVVDMSGGRVGRVALGPTERDRSYRGRRARAMAKRVPQEPGRPRRFHRDFRLGNRKTNSPEPPVVRRRPKGANIRRIGGIGRAKATKRGEMDGGESERLIVPMRPGNRSEGTRRREGDAVSGHRWRETWRVLRNPWRCSRNDNGSRNSEERASEMTSQMREIRTSGSVGARGEQSPRATRPFFCAFSRPTSTSQLGIDLAEGLSGPAHVDEGPPPGRVVDRIDEPGHRGGPFGM